MKKIIISILTVVFGFFFFQNINAQTIDEQYFELVDHCRALLKEDKKAARAIYETQLIEADDYFANKIEDAEEGADKKRWEEAYEQTRDVITEVYDTEVENLQKAFRKSIEKLEEDFKARKRAQQNRRSNLKRG